MIAACGGPEKSVDAEIVSGGSRAREALRLAGELLSVWTNERLYQRSKLCDVNEWRSGKSLGSAVWDRVAELNRPENAERKSWVENKLRQLGSDLAIIKDEVPISIVSFPLSVDRPGGRTIVDARINNTGKDPVIEIQQTSIFRLSRVELAALRMHEDLHTWKGFGNGVTVTDTDRIVPNYPFVLGAQAALDDLAGCAVFDAVLHTTSH